MRQALLRDYATVTPENNFYKSEPSEENLGFNREENKIRGLTYNSI